MRTALGAFNGSIEKSRQKTKVPSSYQSIVSDLVSKMFASLRSGSDFPADALLTDRSLFTLTFRIERSMNRNVQH